MAESCKSIQKKIAKINREQNALTKRLDKKANKLISKLQSKGC